MSMPIPSIKDIIDSTISIKSYFEKKKYRLSFNAWQTANQENIFEFLIWYYQNIDEYLFSYPGGNGTKIKIPLYVDPKWLDIKDDFIKMEFSDNKNLFTPSKTQIEFWEFYCKFKKYECNIDKWPLYDSDIFRLMNISQTNKNVRLSFELGKFSDTIMCQYLLEHELLLNLFKHKKFKDCKLRLRDGIASNSNQIFNFFHNNISRIGVSNLILLKSDKDNYIPMIYPRASLSLERKRLLHVVSSCIFEVGTTPKADFELRHTVLREIYEELYGNPDVTSQSKNLDPYFFYKEDGISDLLSHLKDGSAVFKITGFCIDLIRIVPEITTLLIVNDKSYYKKHFNPKDKSIAAFKLNLEFNLASSYQIPSNINDLDSFLCYNIKTFPDDSRNNKGFLPVYWSLPGGFSFYQGLKKAINNRLL